MQILLSEVCRLLFGLNKYLNMYQLSFNTCRNLGADFQNVKSNELPIVLFWLNGWNNESISLRKYLYPRWKTLTRGGKKIKWERIGGETMSLPIKKYIKVKDFFYCDPVATVKCRKAYQMQKSSWNVGTSPFSPLGRNFADNAFKKKAMTLYIKVA